MNNPVREPLELPPGVVALVPDAQPGAVSARADADQRGARRSRSPRCSTPSRASAPLGIVLQKNAQAGRPGAATTCIAVGTLARGRAPPEPPGDACTTRCARACSASGCSSRSRAIPSWRRGSSSSTSPSGRVDRGARRWRMQLRERALETAVAAARACRPSWCTRCRRRAARPQLADITASVLDAEMVEKQALLETLSTDRAACASCWRCCRTASRCCACRREIGERTKEQLDDRERKFLLREQLKTIQKELGESGERGPGDRAPRGGDRQGRHAGRHRSARAQGAAAAARHARTRPASRPCCAPGSTGWSSCPGRRPPRRRSTCRPRARRWRPTTSASSASSSASSNSWRCASSTRRAARPSCASSARPASARPRSGRASRGRCSGPSCACRWAACTTRPRSAATAAPTSARCRATSCRACARPARATA